MKTKNLPVTEVCISDRIGRSIKSPILVGTLNALEINPETFIEYFSPLFKELNWDYYDSKRMQIEFLQNTLPSEKENIQAIFKDYYSGRSESNVLNQWVDLLSDEQRKEFDTIQPWRRRSVATFTAESRDDRVIIDRIDAPESYIQEVDDEDIRSWPRIFDEAPEQHVENDLFLDLIGKAFKLVQEVRDNVQKIKLTAHFMSVKATETMAGDNSPEGMHEDGADFIISALVINRINLIGGESQIVELLPDGTKEIILKRTLQPGEFIFQADTRDEIVYGTDLWHHVTPFYLEDAHLKEGWRDIIGFDINVVS